MEKLGEGANGWKEDTLLENAISPLMFNHTIGKNATDMAMVIDAMDILYSGKVDGFCLVTSDSDFTKLAMRLREEQTDAIGMGESKTPLALTKACNKFIHLDLISGEVEEKAAENGKNQGGGRKPKAGAQEEKQDSTVTPIGEIEEAIYVSSRIMRTRGIDLSRRGGQQALARNLLSLMRVIMAIPIIVQVKLWMLLLQLLQHQRKIVHFSPVLFQKRDNLFFQIFQFRLLF